MRQRRLWNHHPIPILLPPIAKSKKKVHSCFSDLPSGSATGKKEEEEVIFQTHKQPRSDVHLRAQNTAFQAESASCSPTSEQQGQGRKWPRLTYEHLPWTFALGEAKRGRELEAGYTYNTQGRDQKDLPRRDQSSPKASLPTLALPRQDDWYWYKRHGWAVTLNTESRKTGLKPHWNTKGGSGGRTTSKEPNNLELSLLASSLLVYASARMYNTNGLSVYGPNSLPHLSPVPPLLLTGNPLIRLQQSSCNSQCEPQAHCDSPLQQWFSMSHMVISVPVGWGWQRKCQRGGEAELDPEEEGSSLGREEKAFLQGKQVLQRFQGSKNVTSLLGNCEQFIQAIIEHRVGSSKRWGWRGELRPNDAILKIFGCCPTEYKEPKVFKQRSSMIRFVFLERSF